MINVDVIVVPNSWLYIFRIKQANKAVKCKNTIKTLLLALRCLWYNKIKLYVNNFYLKQIYIINQLESFLGLHKLSFLNNEKINKYKKKLSSLYVDSLLIP
jgi:hypothetical protein